MNAFNQFKWSISRKAKFQNINKQISSQILKPKASQITIKKIYKSKISRWEEGIRKYLTFYLTKSFKIIFKICIISFFLKMLFYHMRQYHKAFIRDLSYMQIHGYAKRSEYENLMNGKDSYEYEKIPNSNFYSLKYNPKDVVSSLLKVFDKYFKHPEFAKDLGNFLLMLLQYEPLRPPRNDFISILLSDYINAEDFMGSIFRLLKIWFLNDDFQNVLFEKIQEAIFSENFKYSLLDALLNEVYILLELPEVKKVQEMVQEYLEDSQYSKDHSYDMSDPVKVKKVLKKIRRDKVFYEDISQPPKDHFVLTKYNKFFLRTIYDFMLEEPERPIIDFEYYENPLFKYSKSFDELYEDDEILEKYKK